MRIPFFALFVVALAPAVALVPGCGKDDPAPATTNTAVSDEEIGATVAAINKGEIDAANVAKDKAQRASVKSFAEMMISMHTAAANRQTALLQQVGITPREGATTTKVETDADAELAKLQAASGAEFDLVYMQGQVTMHQAALDLITQTFLPAARRAELKTELETARGEVQTHLDQAKAIVAEIEGGETGPADGGDEDAATDTSVAETGETGADAGTDATGDGATDGG